MPNRREWFAALAATGVGGTTFQRALAATADEATNQPETKPTGITAEMIEQAEWVAGIQLTPSERRTVAATLTRISGGLRQMRAMPLPNDVAPAVHFHPSPTLTPFANARGLIQPSPSTFQKPANDEDLFFASVNDQRYLLRTKQISSVELTKLYLTRLKQLDPLLNCVVRFTDDLALKQAEQADRELAAGTDRGPLMGIPWGAKDLIAYPGYPTTWGAAHYRQQQLNTKATVAKKLEDAGAVMIAKTTLGALAMGDQWFGGRTNSPWKCEAGFERFVGRFGVGGRGGRRGLRDWQRNARQHRVPQHALRRDRTASHVRPRESRWLHDALVDTRQARTDGSQRRRLCADSRCDSGR
jgi:Amidase